MNHRWDIIHDSCEICGQLCVDGCFDTRDCPGIMKDPWPALMQRPGRPVPGCQVPGCDAPGWLMLGYETLDGRKHNHGPVPFGCTQMEPFHVSGKTEQNQRAGTYGNRMLAMVSDPMEH